MLSACGGGGGGPSIQTGQFLDSAVSGLTYSTESRSGVTDANGSFYYMPGEIVTFRIQGLYIGEAPGAAVLTPTLVTPSGKHIDYSLNVLRLLQSLDSDQTPGNGITLRSLQSTPIVDFNQSTDNFTNDPNVTNLMRAVNATLVSPGSASGHFQSTLGKLATLSSNSSYTLNLTQRTVSRATMRLDTCPNHEYVWSLAFNEKGVNIKNGHMLRNQSDFPCGTDEWSIDSMPYVSSGTSMKTNAWFIPCGPVCTWADLNSKYDAVDDNGRPFTAVVAHMAGTREILITKQFNYPNETNTPDRDDPRPRFAYFRLILSAP